MVSSLTGLSCFTAGKYFLVWDCMEVAVAERRFLPQVRIQPSAILLGTFIYYLLLKRRKKRKEAINGIFENNIGIVKGIGC